MNTLALYDTFVRIFGRDPDGIWAAPGRVNLIGEHTDYNDGLVMPFALPHSTYAAAARTEGDCLRVYSVNSDQTVEVPLADLAVPIQGWAAYVAGVIWSLEQSGYALGALDVVVDTDVPQGAGLSSSAALECSVALAATELYGHHIPRLELAEIAQRAENEYVGMPCGLMDQMVAMMGQDGHVVQFDTQSRTVEAVPFNAEGAEILVVDTRAPHRLVDGEYAARRRQCEQAAEELGLRSLRELHEGATEGLVQVLPQLSQDVLRRRVRHVVTENQRVRRLVAVLAQGDLVEAGALMNASHASLRDDYEVTVDEVDLAQETLVKAGAYGARITGGGFGGCVIALVEREDTERLGIAVQEAYSSAGFNAPESFVAVPSQGARRL